MKENFKKHFTNKEEKEIARALARSEEDFKDGKWFDHDEFKRRLEEKIATRQKNKLCS
ncbi:MAG: hypothetical protein IJ867_01745 [Clostridia bacterium]|nr:hypothetical protein [Clostridia bacterium]